MVRVNVLVVVVVAVVAVVKGVGMAVGMAVVVGTESTTVGRGGTANTAVRVGTAARAARARATAGRRWQGHGPETGMAAREVTAAHSTARKIGGEGIAAMVNTATTKATKARNGADRGRAIRGGGGGTMIMAALRGGGAGVAGVIGVAGATGVVIDLGEKTETMGGITAWAVDGEAGRGAAGAGGGTTAGVVAAAVWWVVQGRSRREIVVGRGEDGKPPRRHG
jgi:hypothetical protein